MSNILQLSSLSLRINVITTVFSGDLDHGYSEISLKVFAQLEEV